MSSARFTKLEGTIARVSALFLPPAEDPTGAAYGPDEIDRSAAFIAMAHAAIQHYIDDRVRELADGALASFSTYGNVSVELLTMVAYGRRMEPTPQDINVGLKAERSVTQPDPWEFPPLVRQLISKSFLDFEEEVRRKNNGIKTYNLTKLLLPLGFSSSGFNDKWLAKMDTIGTDRGNQVHKSLGSTILSDPFSYARDIRAAVYGDVAWSPSPDQISSLASFDSEVDTRLRLM